jgi:hypothetical protein
MAAKTAAFGKLQLKIVSAIELHTTSELSELITVARINILPQDKKLLKDLIHIH